MKNTETSDRKEDPDYFREHVALLNQAIARCPGSTMADIFSIVVRPPRRGGGKRLMDCDDQELAALAILLRLNIAEFRAAATAARAGD